MLNHAEIMGRLTADPELKTTKSGVAVTSFSVAVERNYEVNGKRPTDFLNVVAWRGTAEFVTKWFRKGQMIVVEGAIETREYEDRNGNKRTAVEINADRVHFAGEKKQEGNNTATTENASQGARDDFSHVVMDDELPF